MKLLQLVSQSTCSSENKQFFSQTHSLLQKQVNTSPLLLIYSTPTFLLTLPIQYNSSFSFGAPRDLVSL